jgi:hypothetical protein
MDIRSMSILRFKFNAIMAEILKREKRKRAVLNTALCVGRSKNKCPLSAYFYAFFLSIVTVQQPQQV